MTHSFWATLKVNIVLSDEEFDFLFKTAESHYDFAIKEMTKLGGRLYGAKNKRTSQIKTTDIEYINSISDLSFRELDSLIKCLEMEVGYGHPIAKNLDKRFRSIIIEMASIIEQINKPFKK